MLLPLNMRCVVPGLSAEHQEPEMEIYSEKLCSINVFFYPVYFVAHKLKFKAQPTKREINPSPINGTTI